MNPFFVSNLKMMPFLFVTCLAFSCEKKSKKVTAHSEDSEKIQEKKELPSVDSPVPLHPPQASEPGTVPQPDLPPVAPPAADAYIAKPVREKAFADKVVSFQKGLQGGYGSEELVLGVPVGCSRSCGNTNSVLSLGTGGRIILSVASPIADGEGADFIVFENPFLRASGTVFFEPGEVAVSEDGIHWVSFPCQVNTPAPNGCAGYAPVNLSPHNLNLNPQDPIAAGGDAFDLATLGEKAPRSVRYISITDVSSLIEKPEWFHKKCGPNICGFDLDGIVVVNAWIAP
jgi:hypothetical protein